MELLRQTYSRHIMVTLIVAVVLFLPVQISFACKLMDGNQSPKCCCMETAKQGCEKGGGCENHVATKNGNTSKVADGNCCDIELDSPNLDITSKKISATDKSWLGSLDPPTHTDVIFEQNFRSSNLQKRLRFLSTSPSYSYTLNFQLSYLHTQRFRI